MVVDRPMFHEPQERILMLERDADKMTERIDRLVRALSIVLNHPYVNIRPHEFESDEDMMWLDEFLKEEHCEIRKRQANK